MKKQKMSRARRRRIALWSVFLILSLSLALPLASYSLYWLGGSAIAQDAGAAGAANPRANYWRAVRDGVSGYSAVKGEGANILVQAGGTDWTALRNGPVAQTLPWAIVVVAVIVLLYHLLHGRNKLDAAHLSGRKIKRWGWIDRLVHWITAISFIALAITGISMLIGKSLLIPLLGKSGFALWAQASITVHNVVGPVFSVGISLMIVMWIWHNFPARGDLTWFRQGGGLFSKSHPSAGRMNAGEKIWFWLLATLGVAVAITGLLLVSPMYGVQIPYLGALRPDMQQANLIHSVGAIIWTAIAVGHIYIGTAGTEGAFEGMSTGYVSEEWAQQHHDRWAADMASKGKVVVPSGGESEGYTAPSNPATAG